MRPGGFAIFLLAALSSTAPAQDPQTGSRVRLTSLPGLSVSVGTVIALDPDSLFLQTDTEPYVLRYARATVGKLEVSVRQHRHPESGALIGLATGALAGGIIGYETWKPCESWCIFDPPTRRGNVALGATFFGALGGILGTIVGSLYKTDEWTLVAEIAPVTMMRSTGRVGVAFYAPFQRTSLR